MASSTPAQQVADKIDEMTKMSTNLETSAKELTMADGSLFAAGQGKLKVVIEGFQEIAKAGSAFVEEVDGETKYEDSDSVVISDAFSDFVGVHQELLKAVIGKSGILNAVAPVGKPMVAVLQKVDGVVGTLTASLVGMAEPRAKELQSSSDALGSTMETAVQAYDG